MTSPNAVITLSEGLKTPVVIGGGARIVFIAGPCQMQSRQHALETAHALKEIGERLNLGIIYKTSFDKANRTSASAARGIGPFRRISHRIRRSFWLRAPCGVQAAGGMLDMMVPPLLI